MESIKQDHNDSTEKQETKKDELVEIDPKTKTTAKYEGCKQKFEPKKTLGGLWQVQA